MDTSRSLAGRTESRTRRCILAMVRIGPWLRGIQERHPAPVSERDVIVWDSPNRPAFIRAASGAGERRAGPDADRRHRPRFLLRDRSMEYFTCACGDPSCTLSGTSDARVADLGTRPVFVRKVRALPGRHPESDRQPQLSSVCTPQRATESMRWRRQAAPDRQTVELLFLRRGRQQQEQAAVRVALIVWLLCCTGAVVYFLRALYLPIY